MKFKKIMLVTFLLLAVLTIGAVSASDDVTVDGNMTASDVAEDPIEETPVDEVIADDLPQMEIGEDDFNVWVTNQTLDVDKDKDEVVITFTSPEGADGDLDIFLNDIYKYSVSLSNETSGKTFNVTLDNLRITESGSYSVSFSYDNEPCFEHGTITAVKYYSADEFDTMVFDTITDERYRVYSFSKVPVYGNLIVYVNGEKRYDEHIDDKSPYLQLYVGDLGITDNANYNITTEYVVDGTGQVVALDSFMTAVSCMPVSMFVTELPIDVANEYSANTIGRVYDDNGIRGTVTAYIDDHQVFTKQYTVSDDKYYVYIDDFTYYEGFTLGNHTVKIVYLKSAKEYSKEGNVTFYADPTITNPYSMYVGDERYITVKYYKGVTGTLVVYNTEDDNTAPTGWKKGTVFMTADLNGNGTINIPLSTLAEGYHGFCLNITLGTYSVEKYIDVNVQTKPDTRPVIIFNPVAYSIDYGNDVLVTVKAVDDSFNLIDTFSGNVLVEIRYLDGKVWSVVDSKDVVLNNGIGSDSFSDLNAGEYAVILYVNDTEEFRANPASTGFNVNKIASEILFDETVIDMDAGNPLNLTVETDGAIGIAAVVDGNDVAVEGNKILIPALGEGTHVLSIVTVVDNNHFEVYKNVTLNVSASKSAVAFGGEVIEFYQNESGSIEAIVSHGKIGEVKILDHPEIIPAVNGSIITISGLAPGNYILSLTTDPDEFYSAVVETIPVVVVDSEASFELDNITFDYGSEYTYTVTGVARIVSCSINATGDHVSWEGSTITISGLDAGDYVLTVEGIVPIERAIVKTAKVTVNKVDPLIIVWDVSLGYGSSSKVTVETIGADSFVATIDGKEAEVKDNEVVLPVLGVGDHILSVTTVPDANHFALNINATITVVQSKTTVTASKVSTTYGTSKNIVATLKDAKGKVISGKKVTVTLNGQTYIKTTNGKGQITVAISKTLAVKTHTATIKFAGDENYTAASGKVSVVVSKATPKLTASAKTLKIKDKTKKYVVTLKTDKNAAYKNAKVTIKVNKMTYTAKTNAKGVATFKLTKLVKKGKFTATVKFAGDSKYKAVSKSVKITVK